MKSFKSKNFFLLSKVRLSHLIDLIEFELTSPVLCSSVDSIMGLLKTLSSPARLGLPSEQDHKHELQSSAPLALYYVLQNVGVSCLCIVSALCCAGSLKHRGHLKGLQVTVLMEEKMHVRCHEIAEFSFCVLHTLATS